jgi:Domain of unknown function (DUF4421)
MVKNTILVLLLFGYFVPLSAQPKRTPSYDTSFYKSYKGTIITRVFLSRDYDIFTMKPPPGLETFAYHANTPLNIGLGLTYKALSLSISTGLNFLTSDQTKGPTKSLNLQAHLYRIKWVIDAVADFDRGLYLTPPGLAATEGQSYYKRPDMYLQTFGTSIIRVLNGSKFSYGAGLSQNAWQEKSAGSFLIGFQAYYNSTSADSTLAPAAVDSAYSQRGVHKLHFFELGPGVGYAYTFVFEKHYFLLASLNLNLNLCYAVEIGKGDAGKVSVSPNYLFRVGGGYNGTKWGLSLLWVAGEINAQGESTGYTYRVTSGSYKLIFARRLAINRKMKTILEKGAE